MNISKCMALLSSLLPVTPFSTIIAQMSRQLTSSVINLYSPRNIYIISHPDLNIKTHLDKDDDT